MQELKFYAETKKDELELAIKSLVRAKKEVKKDYSLANILWELYYDITLDIEETKNVCNMVLQ